MGYYETLTPTWEYNTRFSEEQLKKLRVEIREEEKRLHNGQYITYHFFKLPTDYAMGDLKFYVDEDMTLTDIETEDGSWHAKYYDAEDAARLLKEILEEGEITLFFDGEDGEKYAVKIRPDEILEGHIQWEWRKLND